MRNFWIGKQIFGPLVVAVALQGSGECFAADELQVKLSVKENVERRREAERKGDVNSWPFYSIYRDATIENCKLNMAVSNPDDQEAACQLEWYFVTERRIDKSTPTEKIIVYPGKKEIVLPGGDSMDTATEAEFIYARILVDEYKAYGNRNINQREYYEGDTYVGYIVLVTANGKIIDQVFSHAWLQGDKWLEKCRQSTARPSF